jgi:hypothetical protein
MAMHDLITLEGEHGQYQTRVGALDLMIQRYLPASVNDLQEIIREESGDPTYKIHTVTEGLMILAEYRGHATN